MKAFREKPLDCFYCLSVWGGSAVHLFDRAKLAGARFVVAFALDLQGGAIRGQRLYERFRSFCSGAALQLNFHRLRGSSAEETNKLTNTMNTV